ncbi:hypothetical protein cypCar_00021070 [Cyprinus carpio]|nr:hypothetical protein cypCar_00021070 [Cyprinus carpio]
MGPRSGTALEAFCPISTPHSASWMVFKTADVGKAAVLGFGKKRSMMELQNLQEALKVEIQIHQKLVSQMKQIHRNADLKLQLQLTRRPRSPALRSGQSESGSLREPPAVSSVSTSYSGFVVVNAKVLVLIMWEPF